MTRLVENLVAVLIADVTIAAITTTTAVNNHPESNSAPYIWVQSIDVDELGRDLDNIGGVYIETFDIECVSTDLDEAQRLQKAVRDELFEKTGTFGDQKIAFANVSSRDDSFERRNEFGDGSNLHVCSLTLRIGVDGRV